MCYNERGQGGILETRLIRAFAIAILGCVAVAPSVARAVVLHEKFERNTSVTPDSIAYDAWNLQGSWRGFLGTPISPNHFITAAHVGGSIDGTFVYQGRVYTIDASHGTNGVVTSADHDLAIWRVNEVFPNYAELYDKSDEAGQRAVIVGRGASRGDNVYLGSELKGWLWGLQDGVQSWGENDVANVINGGPGAGQLLRFTFDRGAGPNEGHLSAGDSGGGLFINDGGTWKLAGINFGTDGPFAYADGATLSPATLLDRGGLYDFINDEYVFNRDTGMDKPSAAYATRISSNMGFITGAIDVGGSVSIGLPEPTAALMLLSPLALLKRPRRRS